MTAEERSKVIKLTEKHCRQMMTLIYKKKMEYFKSGGEDWKEVSTWLFLNYLFLNGNFQFSYAICNYLFLSNNFVQVLERSYPKDPPKVEPPQFNKQMVYENNCHVFEQVSMIMWLIINLVIYLFNVNQHWLDRSIIFFFSLGRCRCEKNRRRQLQDLHNSSSAFSWKMHLWYWKGESYF